MSVVGVLAGRAARFIVEAAIAEIGRCLRPGGTFTALTFRPTDDPSSATSRHA